jgi:hypothetical protein
MFLQNGIPNIKDVLFENISEVRANYEASLIVVLLQNLICKILLPLMISAAFERKRWGLFALACIIQVYIYSVTGFKTFLLIPVLIIVLGLVLVFCPDSASALIAKLLGWILGLIAIGFGISALSSAAGRTGKVIAAILCAVIGGFLGNNPLILAAWFARIIGIVLVLDGLQDVGANRRQGRRFVLPLIVTVVGALLILLPMSVSRLIFSGLGVVVLILGISMLLDRIRGRNRLNPQDDPNIIDAL